MKNSHCEQFFNVHVQKKIEIHPKMIMIWTYENMAHFRPFKSPLLYIWRIYVAFFFRCLLFQVENLTLTTNLENYYFNAMLITYKCTPF
jgi:hypothetical protein